MNVREVFSIHIQSRDNSARRRRWELIFSLTNTAAVQAQEARGFQIARLPAGFVDSSITEGAERLNRYTATLVVLSAREQEAPVEWYEKAGFLVTPSP